MKAFNSGLAALALLLGSVGVVVCLAGGIGVWNLRNRVSQTVHVMFERVDDALGHLALRAHKVNQRIEGTQESVDALNDRVQQHMADWRDIPVEEASDIDQMERQLTARLHQARDWIGLMRATIDLVEQLLEMMESTSAFLKNDAQATRELATTVRAGYHEIDQATKLFEQVQEGLAEIRAGRDIETRAEQIDTFSATIREALDATEWYGQEFETRIVKARTSIDQLGEDIRWRLTRLAVIATFLLLWFAAGQLCLLRWGWVTLRPAQAPNSRPEESTAGCDRSR